MGEFLLDIDCLKWYAGIMENPVRKYRERAHLTLREVAAKTDIHPQAWLLAEAGCYPHILPSIKRVMQDSEVPNLDVDDRYEAFQREKREKNGKIYKMDEITLTGLGEPTELHPLVEFRNRVRNRGRYREGISRMGLAKAFCLHPSELYMLETGQKKTFSEQLIDGLRQAGLSDTVIGELEYRSEEYAG